MATKAKPDESTAAPLAGGGEGTERSEAPPTERSDPDFEDSVIEHEARIAALEAERKKERERKRRELAERREREDDDEDEDRSRRRRRRPVADEIDGEDLPIWAGVLIAIVLGSLLFGREIVSKIRGQT